MFSRQSFKNLPPLLGSVITRSFSSEKIIKQRKSIKRIPLRIKKSHTPKPSIKKLNVEQKVYSSERVRKIYTILKYSTWDSAQEQLEKLSTKWDSYTVNQVLKTHPPMEKAWLFFNWAAGRKNFKHDQYTYTTMLDIFGEAGRISSMMYVFEQMKEKGIKIDVVTYTSLVHWTSSDGNVDGAIDLWREMKGKGCRPTVVSYTAFMKILFDDGRVNEAADVYKEMLESGLSPNCYTYTVLMEYLASSVIIWREQATTSAFQPSDFVASYAFAGRRWIQLHYLVNNSMAFLFTGKFNEALEIFNKMQEAGVLPDKVTCNNLIEICSRAGEIRAIVKILEYMKEKFFVLRYPIYQKAFEALEVAGESDMLLRQVNRHFSAEYSNDATNKNASLSLDSEFEMENDLVLYLTKKHNLIAVDSLLSDMINKGVGLDSEVISMIIEANSARHRPNGALLAYEYSLKMGINIERTAYLALIGLSIRVNSFHKVVEIVEKMIEQGLSLGTNLNSLLIHRLGCTKSADAAAKVFDLLPDKGKSCAEYTALMSAYFSSGDAQKGLETFKIMKSVGVDIALGTYCALLAGLEKCSKARDVEYYRKEKKRFQIERCSQNLPIEETICNLLFARDFIIDHHR